MTQNNTGNVKNKAIIEEINNSSKIKDNNTSNNESEAEIIISISTGMIVYLSIGGILATMIIIAIIIANKKGIKKTINQYLNIYNEENEK